MSSLLDELLDERQLDVPHNIAVDSMGNLYIGETLEGRRVQRFRYDGLTLAP